MSRDKDPSGVRRLKELQYLSTLSEYKSAEEIASYFGVSRGTVIEDITALKDAGCVFESKIGNNGGYRFISSPQTQNLVLDNDDYMFWEYMKSLVPERGHEIMNRVLQLAERGILSK